MRSALALVLFATACTSASPSGSDSFDSVRDRLSSQPTRLFIGRDGSSGSITASRYTNAGWVDGTTAIQIESGELKAAADNAGTLTLKSFEVGVDPIDIPEEVFHKPAQLSDVRIKLSTPVSGQTTWTSDDDATVTLSLSLDLEWAIAINDTKTPLGTQHLPPVPVDLMLTGAGDHVDASIGLHAEGELWSWAGLLKLTAMEMSLAAETTGN
ncbi:MAG TPA: hypothetical protein VLB44_19760 [Kofleriaceae bacterium]|nr:hypothetical protein [Kofleriaceae bacterium]